MSVSPHVPAAGAMLLLPDVAPDISNTTSGHVLGGEVVVAVNANVEDTSPSLASTRFIVQTVITPIVVTIGLLGNVLNMLVLVQPTMRTSTNVYLLVLSLADSVYLIFSFALSFVDCRRPGLSYTAYTFNTYGRTISDLAGNIAVWIIVIFTVERYVAVCHPIHGKVWCTVKRAKLFSLGAVLFCFTNTFPGFLELEVVEKEDGPQCRYTAFAQTKAYELGYTWWYVTIFSFVPIFFLLIYNSLLIRALLRASRERESLVTGSQKRHFHRRAASVADRRGVCAYVASCCCLMENRKAVDAARGSHELSCERRPHTCFLMCETFDWYSRRKREYTDVFGSSFYDGDHGVCLEDVADSKAGAPMSNSVLLVDGRPRSGRRSGRRRCRKMSGSSLKCFRKRKHEMESEISRSESTLRVSLSVRLKRQDTREASTFSAAETPSSRKNDPQREPVRPLLSNQSTSPSSSVNYSSSTPSPAGRESSGSGRRSREQQKVTLMLVIIVIIFLVCQLPWTILYLYRAYLSAHQSGATGGDAIKIAGNVVNLLVLINASGNFYLYSFFSKRFRRTLAKLMLFCKSEFTVSSV